jgi:zinc/manganese transport system substrate-binding protein
MKTTRALQFLLAAALVVGPAVSRADDKIKVVATIPDLADMTRQVGGDQVEVQSIATGVEDIHAVPMKPSFAVALSRADAVVLLGLEAEHAFLPGLLEASRNAKIQRDQPGYIDVSKGVTPLEVPERLDRALGDQHPMGNPHINLDPVRGKEMVRAIADGLGALYPDRRDVFEKNLDAYEAKLDASIARWEAQAAPLRGLKLVSYHPDMVYFAERFGLVQSGTIELRAGIDPTPAHVAELEEKMRREKVDFVVRELHYPAELARTVAEQTGATLVELPVMVGGVPQAKDYISFIDYMVDTVVAAARARTQAKP